MLEKILAGLLIEMKGYLYDLDHVGGNVYEDCWTGIQFSKRDVRAGYEQSVGVGG